MGTPPDNGSGKPKPGPIRPPPPPAAASRPPSLPSVPVIPSIPPVAPVAPPVSQRPAGPARPPPVLAPQAPASARGAIVPPPPSVPPAAPIVPPVAPAAPVPALDRAQLAELNARYDALDELDYFQLLKLTPQSSVPEIKAAFYRESRAYHPDRFFQVPDKAFKEKLGAVYKRLTEAYYVLRDDQKRKRYITDIAGADRAAKLRFSEAAETETKQQVKKEQEEQIGVHPKGRQFYATGAKDADAGNWASAERNLKMALTFEPSNARYKERLADVQQKLHEEQKKQGHSFKIR